MGPEPNAPNPIDPRMGDTYETTMTTLITSIHKSNSEYNRRSREYNLLAARLTTNSYCANSEVLNRMIQHLKDAQALDADLEVVEKKFALGEYVDPSMQTMAKWNMSQLVKELKECAKIKLSHWQNKTGRP